jgi:4-amino-4-deoxy-L-arabinose transferase-like glycosyltransferase
MVRNKKFNLIELLCWVLIAICVLLVLIPINPARMIIASRDSGVFLYNGWRIVNGGIPYKDSWDQKPPVIFFLNAIGLLLSGNSRWGIWGIEVLSLLVAAILSFELFKKAFDIPTSLFTVFLWLFTLGFTLDGGNFTEEFALPIQFACLLLAWRAEDKFTSRRHGILIGILSGILFYLKQNTIGIFIAILIYIVVSRALARKWRELMRIAISILGGFLLVSMLFVFLFLGWGALRDFWSAAFLYNFYYAAVPRLFNRLQSLYRGWLLLSKSKLAWFGTLGWFITLVMYLANRSRFKPSLVPLLGIGLIALPLDVCMVGFGGRLINHYFITLLPVFSLFSAFFINLLIRSVSHWLGDHFAPAVKIAVVILLILAYPLVEINQFKEYISVTQSYQGEVHANAKVLKTRNYVMKNTSPSDTVLVLGAETNINFISRRVSPSRYTYQYPLNTPGYTTPAMVEEFLNAIIDKSPPLIVAKDGNWIGPEDFCVTTPEIDEMISVIQSRYALVIQYGAWSIYGLSTK